MRAARSSAAPPLTTALNGQHLGGYTVSRYVERAGPPTTGRRVATPAAILTRVAVFPERPLAEGRNRPAHADAIRISCMTDPALHAGIEVGKTEFAAAIGYIARSQAPGGLASRPCGRSSPAPSIAAQPRPANLGQPAFPVLER